MIIDYEQIYLLHEIEKIVTEKQMEVIKRRLKGFPDWSFNAAQQTLTKTTDSAERKLKKQAGNAVTVNVVATIASKL